MTHKQVLKASQVFVDLNDAQLGVVASLCQVENYEAGGTVFGETSSAEKLYVLEQGKVALQTHQVVAAGRPGRRVTVDIATPSDVFGWSAVLESRPYTLTAVCLEPSKLLAIDGPGLRSLLASDHTIGYHVLRNLISVVASRLDEARQLLISERIQAAA